MFTTLEVVGCGEMEPINKAVSSSSQLYSEHLTVYTLMVKRSHMSKEYNHKGKPQVVDKPLVTSKLHVPQRHINKNSQL